MVQNPPYWRASYALGHPKQRKCKFVLMKSLCSGCPSGQLALPAWRILYHVTASCKGPITSTEFDLLLLSKGHCYVRLSSVGRSRSKVKAGLVAMNDFSFSTKEIRSKFLAFDKNNFALFPVTHENSPLGISFIAPDFHVFLAQTTRLKKLNSKEPERTRGCWAQNEEIN